MKEEKTQKTRSKIKLSAEELRERIEESIQTSNDRNNRHTKKCFRSDEPKETRREGGGRKGEERISNKKYLKESENVIQMCEIGLIKGRKGFGLKWGRKGGGAMKEKTFGKKQKMTKDKGIGREKEERFRHKFA
jgi:hypothetical protein